MESQGRVIGHKFTVFLETEIALVINQSLAFMNQMSQNSNQHPKSQIANKSRLLTQKN